VGGDLTIEFVNNIIANNPHHNIEFLLCPVRHNAKVRQELKELGLKLINESIVFDKGLFYEVIHASSKAQEEITITGSLMWNKLDPKHLQYLEKTIEHYERAARSSPEKYADLLSRYRELKTKLF
jgi:tRNA (adenine22-N1)-methyltransferase